MRRCVLLPFEGGCSPCTVEHPSSRFLPYLSDRNVNASSAATWGLVFVVVAWIGLTVVRAASTRYLHNIESAYAEHYRSHADQPGEMPPPVRWDFEQGQLVPIPADEVVVDSSEAEGEGRLYAHRVEEAEAKPAPYWTMGLAVGKRLSKIPPLWFHGAFAVVTMAIALLVWTLRVG